MAAARFVRLLAHIVAGFATAALVFPFLGAEARLRRVQRWAARLLAILRVRVDVHGIPPGNVAALIVANHVSWLDIFLIDSVRPSRFVGKSEIRAWPLLGWLAATAGTVFIQRGKGRDAGRVSARVARMLAKGDRFAVFPEGVTTPGDRLLPFHASLIQPAVVAGVPVHPVAIRYLRPDGSPCREAAYDGDRTVGDTLREMAAFDVIRAELLFAPPIFPAGSDRRSIAREAQAVIAGLLDLPAPDSAPGRSFDPPAEAH